MTGAARSGRRRSTPSSVPTIARRWARCARSRSAAFACRTDVAVVGFDDSEDARGASPSLATVRQPYWEIAECALEFVVDSLAGEPAFGSRLLGIAFRQAPFLRLLVGGSAVRSAVHARCRSAAVRRSLRAAAAGAVRRARARGASLARGRSRRLDRQDLGRRAPGHLGRAGSRSLVLARRNAGQNRGCRRGRGRLATRGLGHPAPRLAVRDERPSTLDALRRRVAARTSHDRRCRRA